MTSDDIWDFLFKKRPECGHYFTNGLRELGLIRVALLDMVEE